MSNPPPLLPVIILALIQPLVTYGATDLHRAARSGDLAGVKAAIAAGEDKDSLEQVVYQQSLQRVGDTALGLAIQQGHADVAHYLISIGADPNKCSPAGAPPIFWAIQQGQKDVVASLAKNPRVLEATEPLSGSGWTPLIFAAVQGKDEMVAQLISAKAPLSAKDADGKTALHHAKTAQVAEQLIQAGAALDTRSKDGHTPLMCAAEEGNLAVVRKLLERGANKGATTTDGKTALDCARACTGLQKLGIQQNPALKDAPITIPKAWKYDRNVSITPYHVDVTGIKDNELQTSGFVMGAMDAVGMTWRFTKQGLAYEREGYRYTSTAPGATISFTKDGVVLNGFKIENLHDDDLRRVIEALSK